MKNNIEKMSIKVTTKSNLFIGGTPNTFEIGGIDCYTVTYNGKPYIPGSSFKGVCRYIVRDIIKYEKNACAEKIAESYKKYLEQMQERGKKQKESQKIKDGRLEPIERKFQDKLSNVSAQYLFGIDGFNNTPKLLFNDLILDEQENKIEDLFSIDTKNCIEYLEDRVESNPRTYKTIRQEVKFYGDILFYHMQELEMDIKEIKKFIKEVVLRFNDGIYRLGNSGSRGYGKIQVEVIEE